MVAGDEAGMKEHLAALSRQSRIMQNERPQIRSAAVMLDHCAAEQGWGYYRKLALLEGFCQGSAVSVITAFIDYVGENDAFEKFLIGTLLDEKLEDSQ